MGFKKLLVAATGIASIPAFAGQDPEMNQQFAAPNDELAIASVASMPLDTTVQSPRAGQPSKLLTGKFTNAKPQDVLNWLQKNGVNFVIESGNLDKDARITLNVEKQPSDSVVEAISAALNGHFTRRNGIYVFQKSHRMSAPPALFRSVPGRVMPPTAPQPPDIKLFMSPDGKDFEKQFGPEFQKRMEKFGQEIEKSFGPEFQRKMELHSKELERTLGPQNEKQMREMAKVMELHSKDMEKRFGPEFQKKMERMAKEIEKSFGPEFQRSMELRAKELEQSHGPEHEKRMKEMAKAMELHTKDLEKHFGPEFQKKMEEMATEIEKSFGPEFQRNMEQKFKENGLPNTARTRVLSLSGSNLDELISSLTSEQKAKLKSKGYLTPNDLTAAQRDKIGKLPEGDFEIRVKKVNAPEFVLKSK